MVCVRPVQAGPAKIACFGSIGGGGEGGAVGHYFLESNPIRRHEALLVKAAVLGASS
jgi:hypothetical protein